MLYLLECQPDCCKTWGLKLNSISLGHTYKDEFYRSATVKITILICDPWQDRDPPWPSGYDAWLPNVSLQVRVSAGSPSGLAWSLYKCAALWRAVYGPSSIERPLGTIREEKGISSRFRVSISSQYDLSC